MEVPRLGVQSELQLPAYTTAIAMQDPSRVCDLHYSSRQRQILYPLSEVRDQTRVLMDTSRVRKLLSHDGNSQKCTFCLLLFKTAPPPQKKALGEKSPAPSFQSPSRCKLSHFLKEVQCTKRKALSESQETQPLKCLSQGARWLLTSNLIYELSGLLIRKKAEQEAKHSPSLQIEEMHN